MIPKRRTTLLTAAGTAFALLAYLQTGLLPERPELIPFLLLEAATFGAGVAFLATAWPHLRDSVTSRTAARIAQVSGAWILLTWTLADTLDLHFGILVLDAIFSIHAYHATVVAAGTGLAYYVHCLMRERAELLAEAAARPSDASG